MLGSIRKLLIGNGLAQVIQLGSLLLLSRLYQPGDFGLLAQVQSIAMIGIIAATLQLHLTIPLSETELEAQRRTETVQGLVVGIFLFSIIPAYLAGGDALIALVLVGFLALVNTYNSFLVHAGRFGALSGFYIARACMVVGLQFAFAAAGIRDGLVWGAVLAEGLAAIYLRGRYLGFSWLRPVRLPALIELIRRYRSFAIYGSLQEGLSVAAFYAPLLLFTYKYGEVVGGQYAMANRLVWAPVVLLSGSVAQVLYHKFGRDRPCTTRALLDLVPSRPVIGALFILLASCFFLTDFFYFVIGDQWRLASDLMPIQCVWGIIFLASTPARVICRALELQRYQLLIDGGMLIVTTFFFFIPNLNPVERMWGVVGIALVQHSLMITLIWRKLGLLGKLHE